ncbi:hypothetical protein DL769_002955 [Monosporascus sp. CRB-8-3]|nr:hypothetical protein DL769_002955 [Monosporascus sp. CRB-8-3]
MCNESASSNSCNKYTKEEPYRALWSQVPEGVLGTARYDADQQPLVLGPDDPQDGRNSELRQPGRGHRPHYAVQRRLADRRHPQVAKVGDHKDVSDDAGGRPVVEAEAQAIPKPEPPRIPHQPGYGTSGKLRRIDRAFRASDTRPRD